MIGGGELNDHELCSLLEKEVSLEKKYSHNLTIDDVSDDVFYIVSNFARLDKNVIYEITNRCKYIIYEHDHKYMRSRNPSQYKNYIAPRDQIVNLEFYKKAKAIFCQSSFHEKILKSNIDTDNTFNVSGNLWASGALELMANLNKRVKKEKHAILDSDIWHKSTQDTVFYCKNKNIDYELVSSGDYGQFLEQLSSNQKFIFLPKTPETLSRVVVEARMMGVKVITNKRVGACYEDWFTLSGDELIDYMFQKKKEVLRKVLGLINEE